MMKPFFWIAMSLLLMLPGASGWAQSGAQLLEEAIYAEETAGDVAAAVGLYEKIVEDDGLPVAQRAEALYRLTMAQLGRGEEAKARRSLARLVDDFPEATTWIEKAKSALPPDSQLASQPWSDGELLEFAVELPTGMEIGTLIVSTRATEWQSEDAWQFEIRRLFGQAERGLGRIFVTRDDMTPLEGQMRHSMLGQYVATYGGEGIEIVGTNKNGEIETNRLSHSGTVYDNEQVIHLLRGLPLEMGYKTSFDVVTFNQVLEIGAEVKDVEVVKVPAGKFEAFKVDLSIDQKIWISNDKNRYPVKLKFGGVVAELRTIGRVDDSGAPVEFSHDKLGFDLSAPAGWRFYAYDVPSPAVAALEMLDPEDALQARVQVQRRQAGGPKTARKFAERDITALKGLIEGYTAREDSWREHTVNGLPAASFVADFVDPTGARQLDLRTYLLADDRVAFFSFFVRPELLDAQREMLFGIVESLKFE